MFDVNFDLSRRGFMGLVMVTADQVGTLLGAIEEIVKGRTQ